MKIVHKPLLVLLLGAMTLAGAAGAASARGHGFAGGPGGCPGLSDCPGLASAKVTPELRASLEKLHNDAAPVRLELKAKRQELKAKIYSGADEATLQALTREIAALQAKVTESNVAMHKQLAAAGVPLREGPWHGKKRHGFKGNHGKGFHRGPGFGPCYQAAPGALDGPGAE